MKKLFSLALVVVLLFSLVSCGNLENDVIGCYVEDTDSENPTYIELYQGGTIKCLTYKTATMLTERAGYDEDDDYYSWEISNDVVNIDTYSGLLGYTYNSTSQTLESLNGDSNYIKIDSIPSDLPEYFGMF